MCYTCFNCGACGKEVKGYAKKCLACGQQMDSKDTVCPHCGAMYALPAGQESTGQREGQ